MSSTISTISTISIYICQNIHFTNIFINIKSFKSKKLKLFGEKKFRMSSLFINKLYFSL